METWAWSLFPVTGALFKAELGKKNNNKAELVPHLAPPESQYTAGAPLMLAISAPVP